MSGQSAINGKYGKAVIDGTLVTRLTNWRINPIATTSVWADSESAGYANSLTARKHATGTIGGKFDTNKKPYTIFDVGDNVILALFNELSSTLYWLFLSANITSFEMETDIDGLTVVGWTANWEADGIFYSPSQNKPIAVTLPSS